MPSIEMQCPKCERNINIQYGQTIYNEEILFFMEYRCERGFNRSEDSIITPDKFREEIISESGLWNIKCDYSIKCMQVLRKEYSYTMDEIKSLKKGNTVIFNGTLVEMKLLEYKMRKYGLEVQLGKI